MPLIDQPGTVIVPRGESPRSHAFERSLRIMHAPKGSVSREDYSPGICANLNSCLRRRQGAWVWFLGDDHPFQPDTLMRLLFHDVDMVAPLVYRKVIPPQTVAYRGGYDSPYKAYGLEELPPPSFGLWPVTTIGGAGLLVKAEVIDRLSDPWFEPGKTLPGISGEDIHFVSKAVSAGFECYLDLGTTIGHEGKASFWPVFKDGSWTVEIKIGENRGSATLNPAERPHIEIAHSMPSLKGLP